MDNFVLVCNGPLHNLTAVDKQKTIPVNPTAWHHLMQEDIDLFLSGTPSVETDFHPLTMAWCGNCPFMVESCHENAWNELHTAQGEVWMWVAWTLTAKRREAPTRVGELVRSSLVTWSDVDNRALLEIAAAIIPFSGAFVRELEPPPLPR